MDSKPLIAEYLPWINEFRRHHERLVAGENGETEKGRPIDHGARRIADECTATGPFLGFRAGRRRGRVASVETQTAKIYHDQILEY